MYFIKLRKNGYKYNILNLISWFYINSSKITDFRSIKFISDYFIKLSSEAIFWNNTIL